MRRESRKDKAKRIAAQVTQEARAAKCANAPSQLTVPAVVERAVEMLRARRGVPRSWPGARFTAHAVAKAVRPIVEEIRRQAFGTTAPLKSVEAFEDWAASSFEVRNRAWRQWEEVWPRTPYDELLDSVRTKVMPLTGWIEHFALQHVVLGKEFPGGFMGRASHFHSAPPWAEVTFYPWHLNEQFFQHLRVTLAKLLRDPRLPERAGGWGEPYSIEDLKFLDLLADSGAPPPGEGRGKRVGRGAYWRRLSATWGKRYKERVGPNAIRMRWERFASDHPEDIRLL